MYHAYNLRHNGIRHILKITYSNENIYCIPSLPTSKLSGGFGGVGVGRWESERELARRLPLSHSINQSMLFAVAGSPQTNMSKPRQHWCHQEPINGLLVAFVML